MSKSIAQNMASLAWRTRWPHYHLKEHTEAELKLIRDMRHRNPSLGLSECGYTYDQLAYAGSCEGCGLPAGESGWSASRRVTALSLPIVSPTEE